MSWEPYQLKWGPWSWGTNCSPLGFSLLKTSVWVGEQREGVRGGGHGVVCGGSLGSRRVALPGVATFLEYGLSAETSWRVNLAARPSLRCMIPPGSDWVSLIRWWEPHGRACPSFSQRWNIIKHHLHPEKHPLLKLLMPVTHALCSTRSVKWEVSGRTQSF